MVSDRPETIGKLEAKLLSFISANGLWIDQISRDKLLIAQNSTELLLACSGILRFNLSL